MSRISDLRLLTTSALTAQWEKERDIALRDLAEDNRFALPSGDAGGVSYQLHLSERDRRLVFDIRSEAGDKLAEFHLSFGPFAEVVRDYGQICESYFAAVKTMPPAQIEAIDMARRGIHNEGARVLAERLAGKAVIDNATARRLFTLIFVLMTGGAR